jgi:hypothetical protein
MCSVSEEWEVAENRTYKSGPDDIECTLIFFSTFEELNLPIEGPMEDFWGWSSCMNHLQHPVCTWLQWRTWWAECPLCSCFWLETRLQRSLTCSASARMLASHLAAPMQLLWTDEGAAISTKSTSGCHGGGLGMAMGACRLIRLRRGRMLLGMRGTSVQPRKNGLARRFQPDSKQRVVHLSIY